MANQTLRGRGGTGTPRQRSVAAAARAAAKRAERTRRPAEPAPEPSAGQSTEQATESTEQSTEQSTESAEQSAKPTRSRSGLLTAGFAVLTLLGLVATAALGLRYQEAGRTAEARTAALAAARKAAPVILSYDYRHLDRDFRTARAHLTTPFLDQYGKTTKAVVAPTAKKYRGVVKATVAKPLGGAPAASVVSADPDKAVVLIFMNQVTTSTQVADRRLDLNRVRMTLVRTEHGWKVKAVDAL